MQIIQPAIVGTLESSDVQITVYPNPGSGIDIHIESVVMSQFGEAILATVKQVLHDFSISDAIVNIIDKGALDCVIRSRMQAAICRATGCVFDWKGEDE